MLSVASLLNPAPLSQSSHRLPPSPASSSPATSFADDTAFFDRSATSRQKMAKDIPIFAKGEPKGLINFPPHEDLGEASVREVRKFQVHYFGRIQEYCRHIPYNSGKKDFFEKTGRESFEVFQYFFKLPGEETKFTVMWDYNIGLVRMTPFFKCCQYPKTMPAKMLNMNPGLKEITHSITGGSIMAQGYWMPYQCAKAICATFCYNIAGALIPIFGPDFPSRCIPPEAPEHGRMNIDPAIIAHSTREADQLRRMHTDIDASAGNPNNLKRDRPMFYGDYDYDRYYGRHYVRRPFVSRESPYGTDTDGGTSPVSAVTDRSAYDHPLYSPVPHSSRLSPRSGWAPANAPQYYDIPVPSLWLSAIPQVASSSRPQLIHTDPPSHHNARQKRAAEHIDADYRYDDGDSRNPVGRPSTAITSPGHEKAVELASAALSYAPEKIAALSLMKLSVRDPTSSENGTEGSTSSRTRSPEDAAFPRIKRLRASSM